MTAAPPRYVIRDFVAGQDDPLIFDSWMKACRLSCFPQFRWPVEMRKAHRRLIEALTQIAPTKVASHPEQPVVIYGWACGGLTDDGLQVLYMAFVRKGWRERGIGGHLLRTLFPDLGTRELYYTHRTIGALKLAKKWKGVWNPYLMQELV